MKEQAHAVRSTSNASSPSSDLHGNFFFATINFFPSASSLTTVSCKRQVCCVQLQAFVAPIPVVTQRFQSLRENKKTVKYTQAIVIKVLLNNLDVQIIGAWCVHFYTMGGDLLQKFFFYGRPTVVHLDSKSGEIAKQTETEHSHSLHQVHSIYTVSHAHSSSISDPIKMHKIKFYGRNSFFFKLGLNIQISNAGKTAYASLLALT